MSRLRALQVEIVVLPRRQSKYSKHANFNIEKFHPLEMHSVYNYKKSRGQFLSDSDFNSSKQAFPEMVSTSLNL